MNNTMEYKGFVAKVEYSAEDNCFIGRVLAISDAVEFRGRSLDELEEQFHAVLDDYLATCEKEGVVPGKSYSGRLALRIPVEMHKALHMRSEARNVSINELIVTAIEDALGQGRRGRHGKSGEMLEELPFSYGAMQINENIPHGPHDHPEHPHGHGPHGEGGGHGPRHGKRHGKG